MMTSRRGSSLVRQRRPIVGTTCAGIIVAAATLATVAAGQVVGPPIQTLRPDVVRDRTETVGGAGRIRGRVVRADTREPLPRVQVTLTGEGVRRQVTTSGEGRYEFTELPAGRFTVSAAKGGYLTLEYGQRRPFEPGRPIELAEAQTLDRVDFALPRGAVIAGRVTDRRGQPIVGADISVERYRYGAGGERRLNRVALGYFLATDDRGEFRAFGLMPGEYIVSASVRQLPELPGSAGPIGPSQGPLPTYHPGTTNVAEATAVLVGIGEQASIQFGLVSGRMSRISGTITDSTGRPGAGANLMLATAANNSIGASGRGAGSTAADGSFTIGNVPPGDHFVQVGLQVSGDAGVVTEVANIPVGTTGDDVKGLQIVTSPGAIVHGRVEWDGRAPRAGGAESRLRITASAADGRPAIIGIIGAVVPGASGLVGRDDSFRIGGLLGTVLFAAEDIPPQWTLKAVTVNGVDVTGVGTDVATLGADSRVRVVLTDKVTELTGSVRTARGEAVAAAVVVVLPEDRVESSMAARHTRTARPDQNGVFRLRALPPGRYLVAAVDALEQGSEWDPAFQAMIRPVARRFSLVEGQMLSLDLELRP
jgi:hypothetical protein